MLKLVPATLTAAPWPLSGIKGAGKLLSLDVTTICDSGMVLAPLAKGVVAVARMLICPALLRTSTGNTVLLFVVTLNVGAAPLQLTPVLLPVAGVTAPAGMVGVVLKVTESTVLLAVG